MDKDAAKKELLDKKAYIRAWQDHPITVRILHDNRAQQETLIDLLCNRSIVNIETFFGHFEAVGHLRGLRRLDAVVQDELDEIEQELKEL